jgi:NAD-dependent deacetylase
MNDVYQQAANALKNARCAVAVTGAGISVESGIPDFRGPAGIWRKYPPEEFATIDAFMRDPAKVWKLWYELGGELGDRQPNPGHRALAELEQMGLLKAVITQNIDNLHQVAGSREVIEYHGNARRQICLTCRHAEPLDLAHRSDKAPRCTCGGLIKPDIVMFGELIPPTALERSAELVQQCDVMLIVGTSAQVFPAAQLPYTAKEGGATVIEANVEATDFTPVITDFFLRGPAGTTLPRLVAALRNVA